MSYYAKHEGFIQLDEEIEKEKGKELANILAEELGSVEFECDQTGCWLEIYPDNTSYRSADIEAALAKIAPYTVFGDVFFTGEDNTLWKYEFVDGEWKELSGTTYYEDTWKTDFLQKIAEFDAVDEETMTDVIVNELYGEDNIGHDIWQGISIAFGKAETQHDFNLLNDLLVGIIGWRLETLTAKAKGEVK